MDRNSVTALSITVHAPDGARKTESYYMLQTPALIILNKCVGTDGFENES